MCLTFQCVQEMLVWLPVTSSRLWFIGGNRYIYKELQQILLNTVVNVPKDCSRNTMVGISQELWSVNRNWSTEEKEKLLVRKECIDTTPPYLHMHFCNEMLNYSNSCSSFLKMGSVTQSSTRPFSNRFIGHG